MVRRAAAHLLPLCALALAACTSHNASPPDGGSSAFGLDTRPANATCVAPARPA
jgi:hypothetical protein